MFACCVAAEAISTPSASAHLPPPPPRALAPIHTNSVVEDKAKGPPKLAETDRDVPPSKKANSAVEHIAETEPELVSDSPREADRDNGCSLQVGRRRAEVDGKAAAEAAHAVEEATVAAAAAAAADTSAAQADEENIGAGNKAKASAAPRRPLQVRIHDGAKVPS